MKSNNAFIALAAIVTLFLVVGINSSVLQGHSGVTLEVLLTALTGTLFIYLVYILYTGHKDSSPQHRDIKRNNYPHGSHRAELTLQSITDAVITTNHHGQIEYMNRIAENVTGWSVKEALNKPVNEVFRVNDINTKEEIKDYTVTCLKDGNPIRKNSTIIIDKNGKQVEIENSVSPIFGKKNTTEGIVIIFHDETEKRKMEGIIRRQKSHDTLTGLYNRKEFERLLAEQMSKIEHNKHDSVLCLISLDRLKLVVESCGHAGGDELLIRIAKLINSCVRTGGSNKRTDDITARLSGDEFGVILENCPLNNAEIIAEKIIFEIKNHQFHREDKFYTIGSSIGLTAITGEDESIVDLMKQAHVACFAAKDNGSNRMYTYHDENSDLIKRQQETYSASRISEALENNRFKLFMQTIYPLSNKDNQIHLHAEILVRLEDENKKLILPGNFIPAAERYNLMVDVDKQIIRDTFKYIAAKHNNNESHNVCYSINLSGNSLNDENFSKFIIEQLKEYDISPQFICFEITETSAITNLNNTRKLVYELKDIGCKFALDDFGSGHSSFGYLKNLPIDYLKIDGSFVRDMVESKIDHAMVVAINQIGHVMDIKTIAEYVENEEIFNKLKQLGVDYAQGYGIDKPTPIEEYSHTKIISPENPIQH